MNIPGFNAESSLGPAIGIYRGNVVFGRSDVVNRNRNPPLAGTVHPALERHQRCTTVYSGYVTYPMRVCQLPNIPSDKSPVFFDPGAGVPGTPSGQVQFAPLLGIGQAQVETPFRFCRTIHGPWFAVVVQQESCNFMVKDDFTLTISGHPQPVKLKWTGTLQGAPATVGALGNLSATVPTCSCCGGKKQCPDGYCVPLSSSCGPITPT